MIKHGDLAVITTYSAPLWGHTAGVGRIATMLKGDIVTVVSMGVIVSQHLAEGYVLILHKTGCCGWVWRGHIKEVAT